MHFREAGKTIAPGAEDDAIYYSPRTRAIVDQVVHSSDWLVVLGLTALWDSISVYIGPSPKEREREERKDRWE